MSTMAGYDPEALIKQFEEEGQKNFVRYMKWMDRLNNPGEIKVGLTPKDVVWSKNKMKLYRYRATTKKVHPVPVLMVYALINRPYIMDLVPGKSLVEFMVNQGFDVYMLDWGYPGPEDKDMKYDKYVCDYIPKAVKKILRISKAKEVTLHGYCMGGTMAVMYAALHPEDPIRNIILMASPFDFSDAGLYSNWLQAKYFHIDKLVDTLGNVPGEFIDFGNKLLKPMTNFVGSQVMLWERINDDRFMKSFKPMDKWIHDGPAFPGETFRQWIKDLYQNNRLVKKEMVIDGRIVDLSNIKANLLNMAAAKDHIVQTAQSEALNHHVSSADKEFFLHPAGHVSLVVGGSAKKITYPKISEWLTPRSQ